MAIFENLDGTGRSVFSIDKNGNRVELRSNAGVLEYRNNGGAWTPFGSSDHNSLSGLEGGDPLAVPPEYYHLSASEHDDLIAGIFSGDVTVGDELKLKSADGASFYTTLQAGTIAADTNVTFPITNPTVVGQALVTTDTSGTLAWTNVPAGDPTIFTAINDPSGFENTTSTTLTYDANARTFTLGSSGGGVTTFTYWHNGVKYTKTNGDPSLTTTAHADENGAYYFYFNSSNVLTASAKNTLWNLQTDVPVASVIYTTSLNGGATNSGILFDERHGISMDWATHLQQHLSKGAFLQSGCAIKSSSYVLSSGVDVDTTPGFDTGTIRDEDLTFTIPELADGGTYTVLYRLGSSGDWDWYTTQTFPFYVTGGRATYNQYSAPNWLLTSVGTANNQWFNVFVCATNASSNTFKTICVTGQTLHTSATAATGESILNLSWGTVPFQEVVPLYQLTYRTFNSTGAATGAPSHYCSLYAVQRIVSPTLATGGVISGSHNSLSGRSDADAHPMSSITGGALYIDTTTTPNVIQELTTLGYDNDFVLGSYQLADTGSATHDKRLFFDQSKAAFRVGSVASTQWDDANVGSYSAVVGGTDCTALPNYSGIFTAQTASVLNSSSTGSVVIGGQTGAIGTASYYSANSAIVGGIGNLIANGASGSVDIIAGGSSNTIGGSSATIYGSILGGYSNTVNADYSTITGGTSNEIQASATYSGIFAGNDNTIVAAGINGACIGGGGNTCGARSSVVVGEYGSSTHATTLVVSTGMHESTLGSCQEIFAVVGSTAGVTGTTFVDLCLRKTAGTRLTIPQARSYAFEADVVGLLDVGTTVGDSIYYKINGLIKNVGGTTSMVGTPVITLIAGDSSLTGSGVLVNAAADDTNDALLIQVKSIDAATTTINWTASVRITVVGRA